MRDSFVFYKSFREAIKHLPDDVQLVIYNAIADYSLDGVEPELTGVAMAVFVLIKPQIDANNQRFENGKKGGRKNQEETKAEPRPNQNPTKAEPKSNQKQTKVEPNVNVNVNENVNADVKAARANALQQQKREYISFYGQNIGVITPSTVQEAESFITDGMDEALITMALKEAVDAGAKNWKYAKAILNNWLEKKVFTVEQARAAQLEFKNRKPRGRPPNVTERTYSDEEKEQRKKDAFADMEELANG